MNDPLAVTFVQDAVDGCLLSARIHPGARQNAVTGIHADALKISLTTPPIDRRANDALIAFLAETLRLPKARVILRTGLTSRSKTLLIQGKSAAEVQAALLPIISC